MDQETINLLRQAAGYIKNKQTKAARKILVELLRENPEIDQAWYMLSFTVPLIDRQIEALEQALKVNPNNEKALARLQNLQRNRGASSGEDTPKEVRRKKEIEKPSEPAYKAEALSEDYSGDDLLSRRLLGEDKPDDAPEDEAVEGEEIPEALAPEEPEEAIEEVVQEEKPEKAERYKKKVFGIRRGIFLLIILIAIFISIGILGYSDQIRGFVSDFQNGNAGNNGEVSAGDSDGSGVVSSTQEPTATIGIDLPPVWTPTAPVPSEATNQPEDTQQGLGATLIDVEQLPEPGASVLEEFDEIKAQLSAIMDDVELPDIDGYIVQEAQIQDVLAEFSRLAEYRDAANQAGRSFIALGLSDNMEKTESLMQNMWADPNGTLFLADTGNVLIANFDSSVFQKYSYAQSLVQNYRNNQNSFETLGIFPMCSVLDQECEVAYAVAKGEAAFFAEMWAEEYLGETAKEEYRDEAVNWFTVGADEAQLPFLEVSLSLPHGFGKDLIDAVYELDRLEAIDDLYDDLPGTTEQLMHLDKYLAHEEAITVEYTDAADTLGVSWQRVFEGPLGEWKTYLILAHGVDLDAQTPDSQARSAAAGWGGDHAQVFYRLSTQDYVVVAEWAWDSSTDAAEFSNAFVSHLQRQDGASRVIIQDGTTCYERDDQVDCLFSKGDNVVWIQAPDQSLITQILIEFGFGI